jgi:peptide/nickel transport system substrate-binding protein/oligopeptide transport system substrate-binding protein
MMADPASYRRPLGADPEVLDPIRVTGIYSLSVAQQIFDGLVQFDQTLTILPALAQFWRSSRDGLTWTFVLRKGVKFHHGREMVAEDVVYSITRILDPRTKSGVADLFTGIKGAREFREGRTKSVAGLSAVDRYTVEVVLEDAQIPFVSILAVGHAKIVPKDVVEREGDAFGFHPIGTGPFKFSSWERGKEIVLTANGEYFDGAPRVSRLIYRIFTGEQTDAMYDEFRKGNLEDTPVPTEGYRTILARRDQLYVRRPMLSVRFFGFNTRSQPFQDRRVRQAFLHAINHEALVEEAFAGRHVTARGILPPGTLGYNPQLRRYPYDPGSARQLLAQAGYPDGSGLPPIAIWTGIRQESFVRMYDLVKKYLQAVGIHVEIQYQSHWPTFSRMLAEGKFPIFLYTWYADVPDPDNFLFKLFYSQSPRNFFRYANATVDGLLTEARNSQDLQRRVRSFRQAEQLIMDDAPLIPIFHPTYERLFQPWVRSVEVNGLGDPYIPLRKIWLDRRR